MMYFSKIKIVINLSFMICLYIPLIFAADSTTNILPTNLDSMSSVPTFPSPRSGSSGTVDESYASLPICPPPANLICPDINGTYPSGGSRQTCPDTCTLTRQWSSPVSPSLTTSPPLRTKPKTPFSKTVDAVCPINYSQVATYNVQPEIIYLSSSDTKTNIPNLALVYYFRDQGYDCKAQSQIQDAGSCRSPVTVDSNSWTQDFYGHVTKVNKYDEECCTTAGCGGSCSSTCFFPFLFKWYKYHVWNVVCTKSAGLYLSDLDVPVSIVCTRVVPTWKPLN